MGKFPFRVWRAVVAFTRRFVYDVAVHITVAAVLIYLVR